jgi:glycosyltransferase involved in cell wall biosynthesis
MKVLFLTYFWPPSGKASLQWPLKMIQYFPENGIEPVVVTVENETFSQKDNSFFEYVSPDLKVVKTKTLEPFTVYKKFTGKKPDAELIASETISKENTKLTHRLSVWIRMNLFIPDARVGWIPYAYKACEQLLKQEKFDAIITNGPPHSAHIVGLRISRNYKIPHVSVLIDPWTDIAYYRGFKRSFLTRAVDNYLEKKVLVNSALNILVTKNLLKDLAKKYPEISGKSKVLYWGYDEEAFADITMDKSADDSGKKVFVHAGNIFDYQNPLPLWKSIKKRIDAGDKIEIKFIGTVGPGVKRSIEENGLSGITTYLGFLPYFDMLQLLSGADFLLVCPTEKRHVPGKLFEYLRTGKMIVAYGDANDEVQEILETSNAGMYFTPQDNFDVLFEEVKKHKTDLNYVKTFDRKSIAADFSALLKELH